MNASALVNGGTATLTAEAGGTAPLIVLDYDQIVGGQPLFHVSRVTGDVTLQAIYSQSLPYLLPGGDGFGTDNKAGERTISFVGVPGGAQLSRVENYRLTAPGPVQGHLLQAGQRFQAITLLGSGSVQISGVGFLPSFRLDTPDGPVGRGVRLQRPQPQQDLADRRAYRQHVLCPGRLGAALL